MDGLRNNYITFKNTLQYNKYIENFAMLIFNI